MNKKRPAIGILVAALLLAFSIPAFAAETEGEEESWILLPEDGPAEEWNDLAAAFSEETGKTVLPVVAGEEYSIALQKGMAKRKGPAAFLLFSERDAYIWEEYLTELRESAVAPHLRYASLYLYYEGKAVGVPSGSGRERSYYALNDRAPEEEKALAAEFLAFVLSGEEGQAALSAAELYKLYR